MNHSYVFRAILATIFAAILAPSVTLGQDIHFSQFTNSPVNLSPGQAGVFGGDMRFAGNYRNQWRSVRLPYNTFSGSFENKFYTKKGVYDRFLTGGLLFNYDRQGSLRLTSMQIGIPISFTAPIVKNNFITLGVTPQFASRSFGTSSMTFGNQFVDCLFDPSNATGESAVFTNNSISYFDIHAGLNYRLQSSLKRSKLDLGGGLFHLMQPKHNFWAVSPSQDDVRLAMRKALYGVGVLQVSDKADVVGSAHVQRQSKYRQTVYALAGRFHLNNQPNRELAIQAGVGLRHLAQQRYRGDEGATYSDAVIPQVEVLYRTWQLGLSYDINVSDWKKYATDGRGGPELSLIYRIYRVKPLPTFKSCPII